jgi:hypothetical protein
LIYAAFLARFALVFLLEMMDSSVENASRFARLQRTPKKAKYGHIEQKYTFFTPIRKRAEHIV